MLIYQVTVIYLVLSIINQKRPINIDTVPLVLLNLAITEVFVWYSYLINYDLFDDDLFLGLAAGSTESIVAISIVIFEIILNIINIINIFILQDIYTYFIHLLFHKNKFLYKYIHSTHHNFYDAFYTFYSNPLDHIFMNIFSLAVPCYLVPINRYVLDTIICIQIYSAINGHTEDSKTQKHQEHHINPKKRLGSLYLLEYTIDKIEQLMADYLDN